LSIAWDALKAWRGEAARARLKGILVGLRDMPKVLKKRREIQAKRKESVEYLETILSPPQK
jgi:hypothetical protein